MILFFDTETTGLPKNWKAPVTDLKNWPRLVQLSFLLYDLNGKKISDGDYIIRPDGFIIPKEASDIHGITDEIAKRKGIELSYVLKEINSHIIKSKHIVAHNIQFDENILGAEFIRNKMTNPLRVKNKICTMVNSTNYCAINGPYGYKWPKLSELHYKLFKKEFEEAHNSKIDVEITAKCFWELNKRKIISLDKISNLED